jgi:FkbM family methyltransferase
MAFATLDIGIGNDSRKFYYRAGTSDRGVIQQVLLQEDYSLQRLKRFSDLAKYAEKLMMQGINPLIVDAGANIGASSVYFSLKYPSSRVVAIEPGADNHALLKMNSSGLNIEPILGAVASTNGFMNVLDVGEGFWGLRTGPLMSTRSGSDVPTVTINSIYQANSISHFPFITKIDIEGGEIELFSRNIEWVAKTPLLIIELHDWLLPEKGTSLPFLKCITGLDRDFVHIGENIFSIANHLDFKMD